MKASELQPDKALKALLDGNVASDKGVLAVYEYASTPNNVTADDYIAMRNNGVTNSLTKPQGMFNGNVALRIFCRLYSNNSANIIKSKRLAQLCEGLVNCKVSDGYYFELDALNPITDVVVNATSGYSEYVLNVAWRYPA